MTLIVGFDPDTVKTHLQRGTKMQHMEMQKMKMQGNTAGNYPQIRLSSVTFVRPTKGVENSAIFIRHFIP